MPTTDATPANIYLTDARYQRLIDDLLTEDGLDPRGRISWLLAEVGIMPEDCREDAERALAGPPLRVVAA